MIRLFAALAVPAEIAAGLRRRQQGLPGARWTSADNLHITLRFFDEVAEPVAADLDEALGEIQAEAFDLHLRGVGTFADKGEVRAVWAGVAESEPLLRLATRCDAAARRCGLKGETRAYRPHVTLAYLRRTPEARAAAWVQGHNLLHSPPWRVGGFGLYSSWRSQDGSRYDVERDYPLAPMPGQTR